MVGDVCGNLVMVLLCARWGMGTGIGALKGNLDLVVGSGDGLV